MAYDYLIVGSGLFGATFAYFAHQQGKRCLVIDKRPQLGGNVYCKNIEGINVHQYGAHIFHTSNKRVWQFVNSLVEFNRYTNSPVANYQGKLYNLPFNMNTFYQMWGVTTPAEAKAKIDSQRQEAVAKMQADGVSEPRNLLSSSVCPCVLSLTTTISMIPIREFLSVATISLSAHSWKGLRPKPTSTSSTIVLIGKEWRQRLYSPVSWIVSTTTSLVIWISVRCASRLRFSMKPITKAMRW